jgi:hypothetical protein
MRTNGLMDIVKRRRGHMEYRLHASLVRAVLALLFTVTGASALGWRVSERLGWLAGSVTSVLFCLACLARWRVESRQRPRVLRLMGAQRAILSFPRVSARGADLEPVDVRISGAVHWPGWLLCLQIQAVPGCPERLPGPPRGVLPGAQARTLLIFSDSLTHTAFRSLAVQIRCGLRGEMLVEHR